MCIPFTLKTDKELSGLMERPASSPFAVDVNDDDEDDVGRVLCVSDEAATDFDKDKMSCCADCCNNCRAGDGVLFSDE